VSSSNRNDELEQLRTAADDADAALIRALPWIILLVIAAVGIYFLYTALQRKWWFRSRAAYRAHTHREKISDRFGLTINRVSRDGKIVIAPGETEKWQRRGLEAELAQHLSTPIRLSVKDGCVSIRDAIKTPGYLPGRARFSAATGEMLIGVDMTTGEPARITLREKSGLILAGKPGSGKTVLLNQLVRALMNRSEVVVFDGKKTIQKRFWEKSNSSKTRCKSVSKKASITGLSIPKTAQSFFYWCSMKPRHGSHQHHLQSRTKLQQQSVKHLYATWSNEEEALACSSS